MLLARSQIIRIVQTPLLCFTFLGHLEVHSGMKFTICLEIENISITASFQNHSALVGGWLARPHDHFPEMFSSHIWIKYPYFLPYAVMVAITVVGLVVATAYLNEVGKFLG